MLDRRHLPNGRWRAPSHGVDRNPEQARGRACRTSQFAQGELINLPRFCLLGKNLSQSHDGVAKSRSSVELAVAHFAALFYCSGLLDPAYRAC